VFACFYFLFSALHFPPKGHLSIKQRWNEFLSHGVSFCSHSDIIIFTSRQTRDRITVVQRSEEKKKDNKIPKLDAHQAESLVFYSSQQK